MYHYYNLIDNINKYIYIYSINKSCRIKQMLWTNNQNNRKINKTKKYDYIIKIEIIRVVVI